MFRIINIQISNITRFQISNTHGTNRNSLWLVVFRIIKFQISNIRRFELSIFKFQISNTRRLEYYQISNSKFQIHAVRITTACGWWRFELQRVPLVDHKAPN